MQKISDHIFSETEIKRLTNNIKCEICQFENTVLN